MPDPTWVTLTREFRADLLGRSLAATGEMARRWLPVERALESQMAAMAEALAADKEAGKAISQARLLRLQRYQRLLLQVQDELSEYNATVAAPRVEAQALAAALQGLDDSLALMDAVLQPFGESAVNIVFDRLGIEAAENIAALARAGQPLNAILERSYPAAVEGITSQLINGVARGINPRVVARNMVRDGLSQGLNHILLVARDQQVRSYRQASLEQYRRSGVVAGYVRISAKQENTCAGCLALDGEFYTLDKPFIEHPQGRCTTIPRVQGFETPQFQTGETWFRGQPPGVQREILGNGRYEAWKDGQFAFGDLAKVTDNETWGPSVNPTPLKELV